MVKLCYIRASNDCLCKKENLQCTFSDPFAPWPQMVGHTETIGQFVSIQPVNKRKSVILPNEPWIVGIPHNYGKMASKETVLYMLETGPKGVPALEEDVKKVVSCLFLSGKNDFRSNGYFYHKYLRKFPG
ncbi:hypothetical protein AHF37_06564 [Paragonimus kellicotti]|nr:hypothetical protein AHF37_06564 [Paragonimus kellicotti]